MKCITAIFICIVGISNNAAANLYAIYPCDGESRSELLAQCENRQIEVVASPVFVEYVVVNSNATLLSESFCFHAEVRRIEDKLCFNSNVLLVKTDNPSIDVITAFNLIPHKIIPNLYYSHPDVANDNELLAIRNAMKSHEAIIYVSLNQVFTLDATVNDPLYTRQWAHENTGSAIQYSGTPGADMSVDSAWLITTGDPTIKIAVLDSGVDTLHEDLMNNLLPGFDGFAGGGNDTHGYPTPNYDMDGHGTSCAGIIAAEGDNGLGTAGIAYGSKIIPVRVFYYMDYGPGIGIQAFTSTDGLLSGAAYAWRIADADIISTSAGLNDLFISALMIDTLLINAELTEAYYTARNGKGIAMFFSSGNDDISGILWPANMPVTVAVGATSMCDERKSPTSCDAENWGGSYGDMLDVSAPGVKISTSDMMGFNGFSPQNYTYTFNGTSAACPNAAGVGALILSVNSGLSSEDVRAILDITADRVPNYIYDSTTQYGTWNAEMGHGRVNAKAAVLLAQTYQSTASISGNENILVNIYPNPSPGIFTVNIGTKFFGQVQVVDINGRIVFQQTVSQQAFTLDLSKLNEGMYLIQMNGQDLDSDVKRIVINR